ncbi:hypothetical protein I5677_07800 [Mobilitalea sibirica]|uniref:Flavodoxin-like domain-containing protein n=1 Tax=Mobilitalea sibirica TaxID=1462919 RepID=A0A8J7KZR5_9FIRM|nr:flavodoxin [Mobilitalea sibirica]MBH1940788.1 hypothetical protein [Mobilitalea sibirica]
MRKRLNFLILLLFVLCTLASCGSNARTDNELEKAESDRSISKEKEEIETISENSKSFDTDNPNVTDTSDLSEAKNENVLIIYYSFTGTTRKITQTIQEKTGADTLEIEPDFNYFINDVEDVVQEQLREGYLPKLLNTVPDLDSYDMIFVGSPVWWFTTPPPIKSFFSQYDLTDKNIVPFCTYKTHMGTFFEDFEAACPDANLLQSQDFSGYVLSDEEQTMEIIDQWLQNLGFEE